MTAPAGTGDTSIPPPPPSADSLSPFVQFWRSWQRRRQAADDQVIADLRQALDDLGIDRAIPQSVETALRRYNRHTGAWFLLREWIGLLWIWLWGSYLLALASMAIRGWVTSDSGALDNAMGKVTEEFTTSNPVYFWMMATGFSLMTIMVLGSFVIGFPLALGLSRVVVGAPIVHRLGLLPVRQYAPVQVYRPVWLAGETIKKCAEAVKATGEEKIHKSGGIPGECSQAMKDIRRAYYMRGIVPLRAMRWGYLRDHGRRVVARLHQVERDLYSNPDPTLVKLAGMWLTIAERYADGRVGALLDDELSEVEPARSWVRDRIRDALAVLLTVGAVFFTASLDLPQAIEGYVISGTAVGVLILVYGSGSIVNMRRR